MTRLPFLLALLAAVLFGAATPFSKSLLAGFSPFQLAGLLYLGAATGVIPLLFRERSFRWPWQLDRRTLLLVGGAVIFGGFFGPTLLLSGLHLASAASVSMWLNLEVAATALLGHYLFRDQLATSSWIGAAGVLLAAGLLSWSEGQAGLLAGGLVALACLSWAIDNHLTAIIDGITPAQSTFWKGLVAGSVNLGLGLHLQPYAANLNFTLAALILGVFSYGTSIVLYITAAQNLGATRSQLVFASAPFFGVVLSAMFLNESLTSTQIMAGLILLISVALLTQEHHRHDHRHRELVHEHWHYHHDKHHSHSHVQDSHALVHCHQHRHKPDKHNHLHWPDLHHRHAEPG